MSNTKISIRFFDDREVRAVWDDQNAKWWFSVLDIVAVLTDQDDYSKTRNYWKYLKAKLKKAKQKRMQNRMFCSPQINTNYFFHVANQQFPIAKSHGRPSL